MKLTSIDQSEIKGKKVLVRGDIDVPISNGLIADATRLEGIWPTLEYLLNNNNKVILCGHIGRPNGKAVPELSTQPVADWFKKKTTGDLTVLENLRFDLREEANDESLAKELAAMADVYVNEAFAVSERAHASIVGVPKFLPHFAGFRLAKEIEVLGSVLENPKRPMLVIIGGAKLETKIPVISKMSSFADLVVVGGKLVTEYPEKDDDKVMVLDLIADAKDTTIDSIDRIKRSILDAGTIVWNGPMGEIEDYTYQVGTRRLAELISSNKDAYKIVGGGDTIGFIDKLGLARKFDWVCSGGGSMLKLLAGEKLPGIEALLEEVER